MNYENGRNWRSGVSAAGTATWCPDLAYLGRDVFAEALGGVIPGNRIVVVGNHPELMDALVDLVIEEPGLFLVGAAGNTAEAIALAQLHTPEVVLIDLEATDISAARIAREINKQMPNARLVALSSYDDVASVRRTIDAGFHRYVSKTSDVADLLMILLEDHVCLAQ